MKRAAASYLEQFSASSTDANCPGGTCTAADAWTQMNSEIPYFSNVVTGSTKCTSAPLTGTPDIAIKLAVVPRPVLVNDSCSVTVPSNGATVSGATVAITVSCTAGQGSINLIQSLLDGASTNMPSNAGTPLDTTFDSTLFGNGVHTIGCSSTDTGGGTGDCPTISVTINNPVAGAVQKTSNSKLSGGTIK